MEEVSIKKKGSAFESDDDNDQDGGGDVVDVDRGRREKN